MVDYQHHHLDLKWMEMLKKMVHSLAMPPAFVGTWLVSSVSLLVEIFVLHEIWNGMGGLLVDICVLLEIGNGLE